MPPLSRMITLFFYDLCTVHGAFVDKSKNTGENYFRNPACMTRLRT